MMSTAEELEKLRSLYESGTLSDDEFAQAKAHVLGGSIANLDIAPSPKGMSTSDRRSRASTESTEATAWKVLLSIGGVLFGGWLAFASFQNGRRDHEGGMILSGIFVVCCLLYLIRVGLGERPQ